MRFRLLILTLAIASLSACSKVKTGYKYLDWAIESQAEKFLDMNRKEKRQFKRDVDVWHEWHRKTLLPKFAEYFRENAAYVEKNQFTLDTQVRGGKKFEKLLKDSIRGLVPPSAKLLASQKGKQIDYLEKKLKEEHEERLSRSREPPEWRHRDTAEKLSKFLSRWFVKFQRRQHEIVLEHVPKIFNSPEEWHQRRKAHMDELVRRLRKGESAKTLEKFLMVWWVDSEKTYSPSYRKKVDQFRREFGRMFLALGQSLNSVQRKRLAKRLREYAQDFDDLAKGR